MIPVPVHSMNQDNKMCSVVRVPKNYECIVEKVLGCKQSSTSVEITQKAKCQHFVSNKIGSNCHNPQCTLGILLPLTVFSFKRFSMNEWENFRSILFTLIVNYKLSLKREKPIFWRENFCSQKGKKKVMKYIQSLELLQ